MHLCQSYLFKKNIHDKFESKDLLQHLTGKLERRAFKVVASNNKIDFDLKPGYTTDTGKNKREAFRILRHGNIEIIETVDSIKILCKFDITYLFVMSIIFGCAMSGLKLINPEASLLSGVQLFFITIGLIFGIGFISLWLKVWNLIKI